ncbi:RDD family protein [Psychrobacillus glaciei]|uniref:RDD family protein n=1 Tax=Psychrobacillus glaciei TaxID=2283160 RepID=A0A5J6SL73_9BACI|nr:RDD family protein [Psychrobacillus glaciei]QFF97514.1 RDD family protein [Psychrobacillus glaciei]
MQNPAGFWIRFAASLLDSLIIGIPLAIISYLLAGDWEETPITSFGNILYTLIVPVLWYGFTIGKKMLGIRIAKVDGSKLGYGAMILRVVVGGLVYIFTFGIGLIVSAFMVGLLKDNRAIHDLIAGTYVTYNSLEQ